MSDNQGYTATPYTPEEKAAAKRERDAIIEYLSNGGPYRYWPRGSFRWRLWLACATLLDSGMPMRAACRLAAKKIAGGSDDA